MTDNARDDTLVVGPAWVGDMVMAQSLFKTLAMQYPQGAIDVVAPAWAAPLRARMPEVRDAHALDAGHGQVRLSVRRALGHALRSRRYRRALVLPRSFKAALVPYFARVPERIGYFGEWRFGVLTERRPLDKTRLPTTVGRYVALAHPDGASFDAPEPALRQDAQRTVKLCRDLGLDADAPVVALLPGAEYGPAKQWPTQSFRELAGELTARGLGVWVLGSKKEHELGAAICASGTAHNLCGRTSLTDAIDLLHAARVAVSNDSGLMHVAAACGAHVVALYGSSSPLMTPPLTARADIVQEPQPCSPCFARTCRYDHYRCLRDIGAPRVVDRVLAAV